MRRFIFTNSDSGAGCLKASRFAERVVGLGYELVDGPAPFTTAPLEFFAARSALMPHDAEEWQEERTASSVADALARCAREAATFDQVELWIDPNPDAQLHLVLLLDWLRGYPELVVKLALVELDIPLGEQRPDRIPHLSPETRRVDGSMCELATTCWRAYRQPTPQPWFELLLSDLRSLPRLEKTVGRLLRELPDVETGLMDTQRRILQLIREGASSPQAILSQQSVLRPASVFGYWRLGQILDELAHCREPVVSGLADGPFTLELHNDSERHKRFMRSMLSLTDLGLAVLEGREDFALHNPIDRWWGGTRLTNDRLWRWDAINESLVDPD
jgi:hypothetical protein